MKERLRNFTLATLAFRKAQASYSSTAASIDLNMSVLNPALVSDEKTVVYQPFILDKKGTEEVDDDEIFSPCTCNLTSNTCDAFCCCDKDCQPVSLIIRGDLIMVVVRGR